MSKSKKYIVLVSAMTIILLMVIGVFYKDGYLNKFLRQTKVISVNTTNTTQTAAAANNTKITISTAQNPTPSKDKMFAEFDFDYGVRGVAPVEITPFELTGGTLTEEADPADPDNQCVKLNKTSVITANPVSMYKDFNPAITQGTVSVEVKVRVTDTSYNKEFTLWSNPSTCIAGLTIGGTGGITALNSTGSNTMILPSIKADRWYKVKLALDLTNKTYDVYVDDIKMTGKAIAWQNQSATSGQLSRMLFRDCGSSIADAYYVDDIIITASNIPGTAYNSGTDTSGMLYGRTCPTMYYVSLPAGWTPDKKWPVIFYSIREGTDTSADSAQSIWAKKRGNLPFIIVSLRTRNTGENNGYPANGDVMRYCTATTDQLFDEVAVIDLFKQIKADYNTEDKFYWTGFSASGHSFWPLVMWRPEFIEAACLSAGNYLGDSGNEVGHLGRGMNKPISKAPERVNLPVKQYTGDKDQYAMICDTGPDKKGMWLQFMHAKAACEASGYTNISLDILPNQTHRIFYDEVIAYFYSHYLAVHVK